MSMTHRELALEFIRRFCSGDVEGLTSLLAEDLELQGPRRCFRSRADYLEALRRDPPEIARHRTTAIAEGEDTVAVFWDYQKREGTLRITQHFRFRDGRISEIVLKFDAKGTDRPAGGSWSSPSPDESGTQ
jgi:ketosteroid isomerase-like protein